MNAKEFVKKSGWELAKLDVGAFSSGFIKREDFVEHYGFDILDDLKTLVDAWEFVSAHESIEVAKKYCDLHDPHGSSNHYNSLRAKIELLESCND